MKTLLLFLIFSSASAQELVYCSKYKDQEIEVQRSIVLVFSKERVRTFVYPIGYVWWEVTRVIDYKPSDKDITLASCELELKSGKLIGYIKVDSKVIHLITVKNAGTLSIIYTRRY